MTHFPDLTPCNFFEYKHGGRLLAVGWLAAGHPFPRGKMEEADYLHLVNLLKAPFQPSVMMGPHECELCQFSGAMGSKNLFVPFDDVIMVAPELITHYINCHGYLPPRRFIDGIRSLEASKGIPYHKALLQNGGSFLLDKRRSSSTLL